MQHNFRSEQTLPRATLTGERKRQRDPRRRVLHGIEQQCPTPTRPRLREKLHGAVAEMRPRRMGTERTQQIGAHGGPQIWMREPAERGVHRLNRSFTAADRSKDLGGDRNPGKERPPTPEYGARRYRTPARSNTLKVTLAADGVRNGRSCKTPIARGARSCEGTSRR